VDLSWVLPLGKAIIWGKGGGWGVGRERRVKGAAGIITLVTWLPTILLQPYSPTEILSAVFPMLRILTGFTIMHLLQLVRVQS
jgi:hypothetical protein